MKAAVEAEAKWGIILKQVGTDEWAGPCPFCRDGRDRFHVWDRGNYWCRMCGKKGFVDEGENLSQEEVWKRRVELQLREQQRQIDEHAARLSALERIAQEWPQAQAYHVNLDVVPGAREWWDAQGLVREWQDYFQVGYCGKCPTDNEGRPSYTIPVTDNGTLLNIRHRLAQAPNGDKYRPHMAGLGASLFNLDVLRGNPPELLIVEGEKKAMVLSQYGFPAVAISGCRTWKAEWTERLAVDPLYIALDPDAMESARKLAAKFGGRARIVALPAKPDDFFTQYNGTQAQFRAFMQRARRA